MTAWNFTRREKILLIVLGMLLFIGLYVWLVHFPIQEKRNELNGNRQVLEKEIEMASAQLKQYQEMQDELKKIFEMPEEKITVMPVYDNIQTLMVRLDSVFQGTEPVLSFDEIQFEENIAIRPIRFSYAASSYDEARSILVKLTGTGQRYLLEDLSIQPSVNRSADDRLYSRSDIRQRTIEKGEVTVTGIIIFYELAENQKNEG